jgi:hypothetical protein
MSTFKDLKIGDKIYVNLHAEFIHKIEYKDGYLCIQTSGTKDDKPKPWLGWWCIPMNHLKATKIKLCKRHWIHISERGYKKYMYEIINREINK